MEALGVTTSTAAEILGVTVRRVTALCEGGGIKADKFGSQWMIPTSELDRIKDRTTGRPFAIEVGDKVFCRFFDVWENEFYGDKFVATVTAIDRSKKHPISVEKLDGSKLDLYRKEVRRKIE